MSESKKQSFYFIGQFRPRAHSAVLCRPCAAPDNSTKPAVGVLQRYVDRLCQIPSKTQTNRHTDN